MQSMMKISPDIQALLDAKDKKIAQLEALVKNLSEKLGKDSHNSSKPPSSDGLKKKTKSLRVASGLKPGGQPGHKGTTLKRVENPDHVKTHPLPAACDQCGADLDTAYAQLAQSRQVFDLPPVKLEVTEHQTLTLACPCGKRHTSEFPQDVTENVQYGARVRAKFVYATQYQLLPMGRTRELMKDWYG